MLFSVAPRMGVYSNEFFSIFKELFNSIGFPPNIQSNLILVIMGYSSFLFHLVKLGEANTAKILKFAFDNNFAEILSRCLHGHLDDKKLYRYYPFPPEDLISTKFEQFLCVITPIPKPTIHPSLLSVFMVGTEVRVFKNQKKQTKDRECIGTGCIISLGFRGTAPAALVFSYRDNALFPREVFLIDLQPLHRGRMSFTTSLTSINLQYLRSQHNKKNLCDKNEKNDQQATASVRETALRRQLESEKKKENTLAIQVESLKREINEKDSKLKSKRKENRKLNEMLKKKKRKKPKAKEEEEEEEEEKTEEEEEEEEQIRKASGNIQMKRTSSFPPPRPKKQRRLDHPAYSYPSSKMYQTPYDYPPPQFYVPSPPPHRNCFSSPQNNYSSTLPQHSRYEQRYEPIDGSRFCLYCGLGGQQTNFCRDCHQRL
jgi:hypothetical protein